MSHEKKKRVLFVDDSRPVLNGLRRQLYGQRSAWDMTFCESGAQALQALQDDSADVVVSDMRMPEMNGAQLLEAVARSDPRCGRLVLSGYAHPSNTQISTSCAHRFLLKPCSMDQLVEEIQTVLFVRQALDQGNCPAAAQVWELPPRLDEACAPVLAALRPDGTQFDGQRLLEQGEETRQALRLLAAHAGDTVGPEAPQPQEVVALLGDAGVFALAMGLRFFDAFLDTGEAGAWDRAVRAALVCTGVAHAEGMPAKEALSALLAGLLHTVTDPAACHACARCEDGRSGAMESDVLGLLLPSWGIPRSVVHALAACWRPLQATPSAPLHALLATQCLLAEAGNPFAPGGELRLQAEQALDRAGLGERWNAWRGVQEGCLHAAVP